MDKGAAPTGVYSSVPSYPAPDPMLSCISRKSSASSHQGGWKWCPAQPITHSMARYSAMRAGHFFIAMAVNRLKGTPRQSRNRQGNCMNRSLGKTVQRRFVTGNMSNVHTAAQAASATQSSRLRLSQLRAAHVTKNVSRISADATDETRRLKAL